MLWIEKLVEYAAQRLDGDREREELWKRGVTDEQIELFKIGYLNRDLPGDMPKDFLEWAEGGRTLDDVFVFPLTTALGQIKGLQFRHVERSRAGYRDFIPYDAEPVFFGLGQAMPHIWSTGEVFLVEGDFDLAPVQRVYPQVVATLTARLTGQLARLLHRVATDIWFFYDWDSAGQNAVERFERSAYKSWFEHHVIRRPGDAPQGSKGRVKDPSELWEAWGDERFGVFLRRQRGL
jgi:DNA primase